MDDYLEEERKIMQEQDADPTALTSDTFKEPISELDLRPVFSLDISASIDDAIKTMQENKIDAITITKDEKLEGIVTGYDILMKVINIIDNYKSNSVEKIMTRNPMWLLKEDKIAYVINNMHVGGYRHVPIVDENKTPIHIVSVKNINNFIFNHFPKAISNITGRPHRKPSKREDA